jgi:hypothetical protein
LALRNAVRGIIGSDLALALADSASQQQHQPTPLVTTPPHTQTTRPNNIHNLATLADTATMSNLIDAEAGTERFGGYEAELKLVQADLSQQIEQIKETTGEPRKAAISRAERALEEADELVRPCRLDTNSAA